MNISNGQAAASSASWTPPKRIYAPAPASAARSGTSDGHKFSEAVASMEGAAKSRSPASSDTEDSERSKKRTASDGSGIVAPTCLIVNELPTAPEEPGTAAATAIDCNNIPGPVISPAGTETGAAADSSPAEAGTCVPQEIRSAQSACVQMPGDQNAAPTGEVLETSIASANIHAADTDIQSTDPELGISKEVSNTPSGARAIGVDTISQPGNIRDASAISSPLPPSDLNTLADAFASSVRNFEQSGQHWTGSASFTLQSSVLQGASFQLTSDGRSLCIQLTQMAEIQ